MNEPVYRRVGVLGAGQLAQMLAEASHSIGVEVICAGQPGDCAGRAARIIAVDLTNRSEVRVFAEHVDIVTIESENIDAGVLDGLALAPNARAIGIAQERLQEKEFFERCGIAVAPFQKVDSLDELQAAVSTIGMPAILKTRRMGYDGKGQARIHNTGDIEDAWAAVGGVPCILERMLRFDAEVSVIGARSQEGKTVFYPLIENVHRDGILRVSTVPYARTSTSLQTTAEAYVRSVMEELDYVGVLAVEFFVSDDMLIANEMAPRVHNSGHWTIEGAATSQFENHLRAITGLPLGSTQSTPTVMLNCIGSMPTKDETAVVAGMRRHDYGKEARPARKLGHLTLPGAAAAAIAEWTARRQRDDV